MYTFAYMEQQGTTIRITKATRRKLKAALVYSPHKSYDEWINAQLEKSEQLDKTEKKK
jgi:hypothetical protein